MQIIVLILEYWRPIYKPCLFNNAFSVEDSCMNMHIIYPNADKNHTCVLTILS